MRDLLLDLSRLLGLALRPRETFDTLEAGTCAGSRAWNFSSSSCFFFDDDVLKRIQTAYEEYPFKGY